MSEQKVMNRWITVVGAILIQFALGALYAWSLFTPALTDPKGAYLFTATQALWIFSVGLATFAVVMVLAGRWQAKVGPRLVEMMRPRLQQDALMRIGRDAVVALAEATGEAGQLAVLREGERYILAEALSRRGLVVNAAVLGHTVVGSATGRVMLAYRGDGELRDVIQKMKAAGKPMVESLSELQDAMERIRKEGFCEYHAKDREVVGLAVPVLCGTDVVGSLGTYLPTMRFRGRHKKDVAELLKRAGNEMSLRLFGEVGQSTSVSV